MKNPLKKLLLFVALPVALVVLIYVVLRGFVFTELHPLIFDPVIHEPDANVGLERERPGQIICDPVHEPGASRRVFGDPVAPPPPTAPAKE